MLNNSNGKQSKARTLLKTLVLQYLYCSRSVRPPCYCYKQDDSLNGFLGLRIEFFRVHVSLSFFLFCPTGYRSQCR